MKLPICFVDYFVCSHSAEGPACQVKDQVSKLKNFEFFAELNFLKWKEKFV